MINYYVDNHGWLKIYYNNEIISQISECGDMDTEQIKNLVNDVLDEFGYEPEI